MDNSLFGKIYNPDVLSCLANLSNDEVFTPPAIVNQMLDLLPQELFSNPDTTFLDPACKTGVFLREIAKRLIKGLERQFPDLQERVDHIFHKQLFGIAITELTSLLSRRGLYCSKYPNGEFSVTKFPNAEGNIRYKRIPHTWKNGKCVFCGASETEYARGDELETYAYEFIHTDDPEKLFPMKFDVIISNPPYHLSDGGNGASASPIYQYFVETAKKLNPRYLIMIIPARWFAGGKGLDDFRAIMLNDNRIRALIYYPNAKDCFAELSIGGGVCYFLWDRDKRGLCKYTNIYNRTSNSMERQLNEYNVFIRYNEALEIIKKVKQKSNNSIGEIVSARNPFGISSNVRGEKEYFADSYTLYSSQGKSYLHSTSKIPNEDIALSYKVMISKVTGEHAGEADKNGQFKVISSIRVLEPYEICTDSYLTIGKFTERKLAENLIHYLSTKFVRFLLLQAVSSINLSKDKFYFVPMQDFSKPWTDKELYAKYSLSDEEINFIESMIRPME